MHVRKTLAVIIGGTCLLSLTGCSNLSSNVSGAYHSSIGKIKTGIHDYPDSVDISSIKGNIKDGGPADPELIEANKKEKRVLVRVYRGDTFFGILNRVGANKEMVNQIPARDKKKLTKIYPNDVIEMRIDKDSRDILSLAKTNNGSSTDWILAKKTDNGYQVSEETFEATYQEMYVQGSVRYNFYNSGQELGIEQPVLRKFVEIMSKKVDIEKAVFNGDNFKIAYRQMQLDGRPVGEPIIIGAEYKQRGKRYQAFRYRDSEGYISYYDENGKNYEEGFLTTPVQYTRVSSPFNPNRFHPKLRRYRPHHGVDLAAPSETKIVAPGAGKVSFVGVKGGYGNVVEVMHPGNIKTIYAHLSRFGNGLHVGDEVKQGQTIAYVGSTGVSTGPHLHYKIRVNGKPTDPMTARIANVTNLDAQNLADFSTSIEPFAEHLANMDKKGKEQYTYSWHVAQQNLGI